MNVEQVLAQYDGMFGHFPLDKIENYLFEQINAAKSEPDLQALVTLLNEMIGLCRDTTQKDKALHFCAELLSVLSEMKLEGSVPYATSLINIANAYRAFGLHVEALGLYDTVQIIYNKAIPANDFSYASLYNNWSLVYQETGEFKKSVEMLLKALAIVDLYQDAIIPQATTRTNLAVSLIAIGTEEAFEKAMIYLREALDIFEKDGGKDFHYGAALVAMGDAYFSQKEYEKACSYYQSGLYEIEKHTGRTENYDRVLEKYEHALKKCTGQTSFRTNLERSREFYEITIKPMLEAEFSEYIDRIAVGLVGEGSDCFGFDDEISTDHDYGTGVCLWLTEADYVKVGKRLQNAYIKIASIEGRLQRRRGVFSINQFYNQLLLTDIDYENADRNSIPFESIDDWRLAEAVNGSVFYDSSGTFSSVRELLKKGFPEDLWRKKLASSIHDFSQYAQSNYSRMMSRKDSLTAFICIGKAVESVLDIMYLLERRYAPYYKWKKKGIEDTELATKIFPCLEHIAALPNQSAVWEAYRYQPASVHTEDGNVSYFEEIASILLEELNRQGLVEGTDPFLELYITQILEGKNMDIIEKIVLEEWSQFDRVKNEGGRADCQDNFNTFCIMRKSQYLTWNRELLESFYQDLCTAKEKGWNLIMEKYARMMESTNPEKYAALASQLPPINDERIRIQEEIIKIQVSWMEEFSANFPKLARNARSIHTDEDSAFHTSYETYLRGEISTYSENTFILYVNFIIAYLKSGHNLTYKTMENTVKLYGYASLQSAESKL